MAPLQNRHCDQGAMFGLGTEDAAGKGSGPLSEKENTEFDNIT